MPTYVLMSKLSPSALADPRGRAQTGREWKRHVEKACPGIRWIAHYALLGQYDFMDIYEAPDAETAFKVSLLSRERGAVSAESWPALEYMNFLPLAETVEKQLAGGTAKKKKSRVG
jgi:uncharacterized protein with GYD domain